MIINANALNIPLSDKSAQMIVTSPPYWGLRDYGTATWQGGEVGCNHKMSERGQRYFNGQGWEGERGGAPSALRNEKNYRDTCGKCGAIRIDNQLGLERTPEEYIANMVAVFRECWRVLRDDGTLWLNCGDSYASQPAGNKTPSNWTGQTRPKYINLKEHNKPKMEYSVKPKDLVGIPWRLAFALQADGWYLRSDIIEKVELYCPCGCGYVLEEKIWRYSQDREIIWNKPNPMPESVRDRPTKSHEYLFLLTKSEKYYYDQEAIREEYTEPLDRWGGDETKETDKTKGNQFSILERPGRDHRPNPAGRNRRTVWTIPTAPYKGAHFATFPPALVEPCIKAGTSERGACPKCGKGWRRVVERVSTGKRYATGKSQEKNSKGLVTAFSGYDDGSSSPQFSTLGWKPGCNCSAAYDGIWMAHDDPGYVPYDPVPCLVFDPFVGSGTTVKVAYDLGRRGVGLDLSLEYLDEQARKRIHNGHTARLF